MRALRCFVAGLAESSFDTLGIEASTYLFTFLNVSFDTDSFFDMYLSCDCGKVRIAFFCTFTSCRWTWLGRESGVVYYSVCR